MSKLFQKTDLLSIHFPQTNLKHSCLVCLAVVLLSSVTRVRMQQNKVNEKRKTAVGGVNPLLVK